MLSIEKDLSRAAAYTTTQQEIDQLRPYVERLHKFDNYFMTKGTNIWNSLPLEIKSYKPLVAFKAKIKRHILSDNNLSEY